MVIKIMKRIAVLMFTMLWVPVVVDWLFNLYFYLEGLK